MVNVRISAWPPRRSHKWILGKLQSLSGSFSDRKQAPKGRDAPQVSHLYPLSAEEELCWSARHTPFQAITLTWVMATSSKRTYAGRLHLPGQLPSGSLTPQQATVNGHLHQRLPNPHRKRWERVLLLRHLCYTSQNDHMDHSFVWAMPCRATQDGWVMVGEFSQNVVHWTRERQTTSAFLPWEPHEQDEKAKGYDSERDHQVSMCSLCYWGRAEKLLQKEWEGWAKAELTAHEWMSLVVSKAQCCKQQYWVVTCNVRSINQCKLEAVKTGDSKSEHRHFRNHWTKKDGNGQI